MPRFERIKTYQSPICSPDKDQVEIMPRFERIKTRSRPFLYHSFLEVEIMPRFERIKTVPSLPLNSVSSVEIMPRFERIKTYKFVFSFCKFIRLKLCLASRGLRLSSFKIVENLGSALKLCLASRGLRLHCH